MPKWMVDNDIFSSLFCCYIFTHCAGCEKDQKRLICNPFLWEADKLMDVVCTLSCCNVSVKGWVICLECGEWKRKGEEKILLELVSYQEWISEKTCEQWGWGWGWGDILGWIWVRCTERGQHLPLKDRVRPDQGGSDQTREGPQHSTEEAVLYQDFGCFVGIIPFYFSSLWTITTIAVIREEIRWPSQKLSVNSHS